MNRKQAVLVVALASILLSLSGFLIKIISVSPFTLVGVRSAVASIVILLWLGRPRFTWSAPQVVGAVGLLGAQLFFVLATRQTTAANAIFIQYTAPIYVALFGIWFLQERATAVDWLTMAAIGVGMFLFFQDGFATGSYWGNFNAFLSSISFAAFMLCMRKQKDGSAIESVLLGSILAALVGLPFLLREQPSAVEWSGLIFMGVVQTGIPFVMLALAIRQITAVESILIQTLEPIFNPVWVFMAVGEIPTPLAVAGGVIVVASVVLRALWATRARPVLV
ncbi:MAG: DMT family transporter [Caldilineaceae bacterium]